MAKKAPQNPDAVTTQTPDGTLKWPKLNEPDFGSDKFPDKDGSFNTRIVFDGSDPSVAKFVASMDKMMERAKELAEEKFAELPVKDRKRIGEIKADDPYTPVYDEDTEEETGEIEMRFKRKYSGEYKKGPKAGKKWFASIGLFDTANPPKPIKKGIQIWGGSVATLNVTFEPYFVAGTGAYGLQRRLNAVQIVSLVSSGGERSASSYGFGARDGGFDSSDIETDEGSDDQTGGDDSTDDDEDDDSANF